MRKVVVAVETILIVLIILMLVIKKPITAFGLLMAFFMSVALDVHLEGRY